MEVCVLTWYDQTIAEYANINYKINEVYCIRNGINIKRCSVRRHPKRRPHWERLQLILEYIETYDYVMWIDADAHFYIDSQNIKDLIKQYSQSDFIFSKDNAPYNNGLNSGVFIVKNTKYSKEFINTWAYDQVLFEQCRTSDKSFAIFQDQSLLNTMYINNGNIKRFGSQTSDIYQV